jgi:hypothetical protein
MSDIDANDNPEHPSFVRRVLGNDSTRRGLATAAAGILIAIVTEALWPSNS